MGIINEKNKKKLKAWSKVRGWWEESSITTATAVDYEGIYVCVNKIINQTFKQSDDFCDSLDHFN